MSSTEPFDVQLAPAAARAFRKLTPDVRTRNRSSLQKLAAHAASPGRIGGKSVKTIQGADDAFHRRRVSEYRVMCDVIADDRVVLVLGIVHRSDLERWLRDR